ncbi:MAG TPA: hypothetical protein VGJ52_10500 [Vicinamibacterales bacterium]
MPLCRTPSYEGRGGASTVPCALTMTAADVTTARRHAHKGEIVPPCARRIHYDGGAVTMNAGGLTMTAAERARAQNHATLSRCAVTRTAAAPAQCRAPSRRLRRQPLWPRRSHYDGGRSHYDGGAVTMTAAQSL